jgi:hypothetical protein
MPRVKCLCIGGRFDGVNFDVAMDTAPGGRRADARLTLWVWEAADGRVLASTAPPPHFPPAKIARYVPAESRGIAQVFRPART